MSGVLDLLLRLDREGYVLTTKGNRLAVKAMEKLAAGPLWEESGLVLTTERGTAVDGSWITKHFARKIKELGLRQVRFHDPRHSHASILSKKGVHPKVIQKRLGHSSINVTIDIYSSHVFPSMQKEAALALDSIFSRAATKDRTWCPLLLATF